MEITRLISETIPEHEQSAVSTMLVGREALPIFAQLIQNQEVAIQKLTNMGDASKYAGSMLKEFEGMAGTSQAQMEIFGNKITAVKIALGSAFLPTINSVMQALTPMLQAFTEWASANPQMDVKTAKEACRAIACQIPAFREFMMNSEKLGLRFAVFNGKKQNQKTNINENQLDDATTANHIHIRP